MVAGDPAPDRFSALEMDVSRQNFSVANTAILALAATWLFAPIAQAGQASTAFAPHRAYYKMSLGAAASDSGVVDVEGRMAFEWRADCDGWVVEQRYAMRYHRAEAGPSETDTRYTAWESKDGKRYRFFVTNKRAKGEPTKIEGFASHPGPGTGGTGAARFTEPEETDFVLPGGTMFPSAHTFALIDAALAGKKFFAAPMFDGSEVEGAASVSAVIGLAKTPEKTSDPLLSGQYWPIRMAFFPPEGDASQPDYEMTLDMQVNGVSRGLVLDYGDFTVKVELTNLEAIPRPSC